MKNVSLIILVVLIAVVFGLFLVTFMVRETEVALVTRFGKPYRSINEPGFYWSLPTPIDTVYKFDSRNQYFEGQMEEPTTSTGDPIVVTTYAVWKIEDPQKYFDAVRNEKGAREKLKSLIRKTQNEVIGSHSWGEFVNIDPANIKLDTMEDEMVQIAKKEAIEEYGIDVVKIGFRQIGVSEQVTKLVFERMKADRNRRTKEILADGQALAGKIKESANAMKTELLAIVEAEAKSIRGAGDAEAAKYFKELEADPEFAMFLRDLESLKEILKEKSTIVLGADTQPFSLLKGIDGAEKK